MTTNYASRWIPSNIKTQAYILDWGVAIIAYNTQPKMLCLHFRMLSIQYTYSTYVKHTKSILPFSDYLQYVF